MRNLGLEGTFDTGSEIQSPARVRRGGSVGLRWQPWRWTEESRLGRIKALTRHLDNGQRTGRWPVMSEDDLRARLRIVVEAGHE